MKNIEPFKWGTVFDIEAGLVVNVLSERISVSYLIKEKSLRIFKDGELCNTLQINSIKEYFEKLKGYYQDAQLLKQFT